MFETFLEGISKVKPEQKDYTKTLIKTEASKKSSPFAQGKSLDLGDTAASTQEAVNQLLDQIPGANVTSGGTDTSGFQLPPINFSGFPPPNTPPSTGNPLSAPQGTYNPPPATLAAPQEQFTYTPPSNIAGLETPAGGGSVSFGQGSGPSGGYSLSPGSAPYGSSIPGGGGQQAPQYQATQPSGGPGTPVGPDLTTQNSQNWGQQEAAMFGVPYYANAQQQAAGMGVPYYSNTQQEAQAMGVPYFSSLSQAYPGLPDLSNSFTMSSFSTGGP